WVGFLSDYGLTDGFVGVCHGVIATLAPTVRVIDVCHDVPPGDLRRGAALLAQSAPHLPAGVLLAVVDPTVGTRRRSVVVQAGRSFLVGPDNGLLVPAADVLGGVVAAYELAEPRYRLPEVSMTFHGRDIFAPAAAHLANGVSAAEFGPAVEPTELVRLPQLRSSVINGRLSSEIVGVDRFGNIQLAAGVEDLLRLGARPGDAVRVQLRRSVVDGHLGGTFSDVPAGSLLVHVDSAGQVAVAVNGGSAAEALGGQVGEVVISPTGSP
ncbi:MAG TPA: SAM-dependent chlorinase/fluorinase, partial [Pseudonocardiaceae bacterium]